jgi:hypothetical protein
MCEGGYAAAIADTSWSLLCHALQFAFKSIAYYIRRATLINVSDRYSALSQLRLD